MSTLKTVAAFAIIGGVLVSGVKSQRDFEVESDRAVLQVMESNDVPARARHIGELVERDLSGVDGVIDVRGLGALIAVEVSVDARELCRLLLERGVLTNAVTPTALRLAPSLLISDEDLTIGNTAIVEVISELLATDAEEDAS